MLLQVSLAGVSVLVERSWLFTLFSVTILAGIAAMSVTPEDIGVALALGIGFAVALALTLSILLHELAHARVSINAGIRVEHIRIHAAGALCQRRDPIHEARHQFSVAAAGPLASVALGVVTLTAAFIIELAGFSSPLAVALWFIAFFNVLVAVSNMLPLLPFDGGKVLHAVFWRASGDRHAATHRVRRGGRQFARLVMAFGVLIVGWAGDVALGLGISAFGIYLMLLPPGE